MDDLKSKKLLILSGAEVHKKIVNTANSMGIYTIVTDYLQDSPSKKISDENWNYSINDIDRISERCIESNVDGVINMCIDPGQIPYCEICNRCGYYCYGTREQFDIMTLKDIFKKYCRQYGISVIDDYSLRDLEERKIEYPLFVKPTNSRGSRGQSICFNYEELLFAIEKAEANGNSYLIEDYVDNRCSFQATYFCVDGTTKLIRTADGYKGSVTDGIDRIAQYSISPSKHTAEFLKETNERLIELIKGIGISNGPVMVQGFYDKGVFKMYDPGFRFPGTDYEMILKKIYNVDFCKSMISFSLTGNMLFDDQGSDLWCLNGKRGVVLFPTLRAGIISRIEGLEKMKKWGELVTFHFQHKIGDVIEETNTTQQRLGQIVLVTEGTPNTLIQSFFDTVKVFDEDGNSMLIEPVF